MKKVTVSPISSKAKNRLANLMEGDSVCIVEQETDTQMFLASINKRYFFWFDKSNDQNWRIVK